MSKTWSLEDAKNRFSAVVEAARRGEPQTVTKRGKPAVVVVSIDEYQRLRRNELERLLEIEHRFSDSGLGD